MPLYDYKCGTCGVIFEVRQSFSDPYLTTHEDCGGPLQRLISAPALQFKGSGFYITDYARGGDSASSKSGSNSESKGGGDKKSESKSESSAAGAANSSGSTSASGSSSGSSDSGKSSNSGSSSTGSSKKEK